MHIYIFLLKKRSDGGGTISRLSSVGSGATKGVLSEGYPPVGSVATEGVLSKGYMLVCLFVCADQVLHQSHVPVTRPSL